MTQRVVILISGSGSNMVSLVKDMASDDQLEPVLVLSNDPAARGLAKATELGVSTLVVNHKNYSNRQDFEAVLIQEIDAVQPDIICLAGFMRVLTSGFVEHYDGRILNIHPSLLPKHKGLDTHERALEAGDNEHGCTVHLVTPELDNGPIIGQAKIPVKGDDTARSLANRVLQKEHHLYPLALRHFANGGRSPVYLP